MRNAKTKKELYDALMKKLICILFLCLMARFWSGSFTKMPTCGLTAAVTIPASLSSAPLSRPSAHWHPEEDTMLTALYALGKKGKILALRGTANSEGNSPRC